MGSISKNLKSLMQAKKYDCQCKICFAEHKDCTVRDALLFLRSHERFHAMKFEFQPLLLALYNPAHPPEEVTTDRYTIKRI